MADDSKKLTLSNNALNSAMNSAITKDVKGESISE